MKTTAKENHALIPYRHRPICSGSALMKFRRTLGISRPFYAILSDCSERTLATQEAKPRLPRNECRRLNETQRLLNGLCEIMDTHKIRKWLSEPNVWLDRHSPLAVIRQGRIDKIWELIYHTKEGGLL